MNAQDRLALEQIAEALGARVITRAELEAQERLTVERLRDPETALNLVKATRIMRTMQRDYFKTRDPEALQLSKRYEKLVDRLLAELDAPEPKQGGLF